MSAPSFNRSAYNALPPKKRRYVRTVYGDFLMLKPGPFVGTSTPDTPFLIAMALFAEDFPERPVKYTGPDGVQRDVPPGTPFTEIDTATHDCAWPDENNPSYNTLPCYGFDDVRKGRPNEN